MSLRILVVDDDQVERSALRRALTASGLAFVLDESETIPQAIARLDEAFDLVLLDHPLPEGSGLDVLEALRRRDLPTPVVALTALTGSSSAAALLEAGADDVLPKSELSPERLAQTVRTAVRVAAAEDKARRARRSLERLAQRLAHLSELSLGIHRASGVEATLQACVASARALVAADGARLTWRRGATVASTDSGLLEGHRLEISLALTRPNEGLGQLEVIRSLAGQGFDAEDALVLRQLGQTAVVALENAWLLRTSEQASASRDELLAIVSHDLRSPVAVVEASADELRDVDPVHHQLADRLTRASRRMQGLLSDLLDTAQADAGTLSVNPKRQSLNQLLSDAQDAFECLATPLDRRVQFLPVPQPLEVLVDRDRILQVLSNLLGNALKFTPPKGTISVEAQALEGHAAIRVRDTGPGIAAAQRPHLFDRFWKGRAQRSSAGLGLYIARAIVIAHGGTLELEDTPAGACFCFTLRRA